MHLDLDCRALVETVTDYLEGTMPARERARFEGHLLTCLGFGCANYVEQMRLTIRLPVLFVVTAFRPACGRGCWWPFVDPRSRERARTRMFSSL